MSYVILVLFALNFIASLYITWMFIRSHDWYVPIISLGLTAFMGFSYGQYYGMNLGYVPLIAMVVSYALVGVILVKKKYSTKIDSGD